MATSKLLPFASRTPDPATTRRLYCFPPSGGGASGFVPWRAPLAGAAAVEPVQYPGRESRIVEPLAVDLRALARDIAAELEPDTFTGYALLGHSMGAVVAFEVVRELRRRAARLPDLLVVSAAPAPQRPLEGRPQPADGDEAYEDYLRLLGGTSPEVLATPELMELIIPVLRSDLALLTNYRHRPEPPLDIPILAVGGSSDPVVSPEDLSGWAEHTTAEFTLELLPGGHFYFRDSDQLFQIVRRHLADLSHR
ncbi:alpha/beta fold hydrolase [Kitasatospora sp. GP82]|uniref:thioesterase II family protein n=1 Tax=Kitasatospora sp. GP82 TaxID=3035089 RepID=UPI002473CD70|nr:alpha/beta fold hydrolase [Kitasatospora sp. GP82]MDH6128767.1 medium-chain acyl-[acyl-carrier-protein] hydrolase [Kitasatospora sp. GP82]